jgi:hypothetical protein
MKKVKFSLLFLCVKDFNFVEVHACFYVCRKNSRTKIGVKDMVVICICQ